MLAQTSINIIRAFAYLASQPKGTYVGATTIAREINAPQNYLGKVLKQYCSIGLLESRRGTGGGLRLAVAPDQLNLLQIVEPIEDMKNKRNCFMGQLCCGPQPCTYHFDWLRLHSNFVEFLQSVTLAGLLLQSEWNPLRKTMLKRGKNADSIKCNRCV